MIPQPILTHFQNMKPGETLHVAQAKDPATLIKSAIEYMELNPDDIQINGNYERIQKMTPWPIGPANN